MKNYLLKTGFVAAAAIIVFAACKKQETEISYTGGTAPVLSSTLPNNDTLTLVGADSLNNLVTFSWTNPNYQFSDGISSQNVTYYIEVDTVGANFTSPNMQQVSISSALRNTFTIGQFNTLLGNGLQLALGVPHNIQVRVESFITPLSSGSAPAVPLFSTNTYSYVVTPYAPPPKIAPPSTYADNPTGTLYIVGAAVAGGWNNPMTVDPATQQFTELSPTDYTITIALTGGGEYKLIGVNGSWGDQWSVATGDSYPNGGPFVFNGNNCIAPSTSGTYTLNFNFQTGTFTVTQ